MKGARTPVPWPARLGALGMIWGLSFLFIKVADEVLVPVEVAFSRVLLGALVLVVMARVGGHRLPGALRTWLHLAAAAAFSNAIPFVLFAYGEQRVSSVVAGIFNATTPLFTVPLAVLLGTDSGLGARRVGGLATGFVGVLVVFGAWNGLGGSTASGDVLCLAAGASYGIGFPYTRKFLAGRGEGAIALATGQLLCATAELAIPVLLLGRAPPALPWRVVASVAILGCVGTGLAYVLNYSVIRDAGAAVASSVTYVIPVVSTLAGVLVLGEQISWNAPLGVLVIVAGAVACRPHPAPAVSPARPRQERGAGSAG